MKKGIFRVLAIVITVVLFTSSFLPSVVSAEEVVNEENVVQDENTVNSDNNGGEQDETNNSEETQDQEQDKNPDQQTESVGTEDKSTSEKATSEDVITESEKSESENSEEEEQDLEYAEEHDLANSFRFSDGEPIRSKARYIEYTTWPTDVPGAVGYGIDVSKHQGKIDWNKVKKAGVDFAIVRCGYGQDQTDQDDTYWYTNADACEKYEIPFGTYLYSYADTVAKAKSEAKHVLRLIKGYDLSYPIYYDLEESSIRNKLSKTKIADIAEAFCDTIEAAGYEAAIYSNTDWFTNYLTDKRFNQWDKWVAQYNDACYYEGEYSMWQCSSKGKVSGINGNVDLNIDLGAAINRGPQLVEEDGKTYCYLDGEKLFGEQKVNGYWYYFDKEKNGEMVTGWCEISVKTGGTKTVYYGEDGRMTYGEKKIGGCWYYFHKVTGEMQTGFVELSGKTVCYGKDGKMLYNEQTIGDYNYYFDPVTGKRLENSWRGKLYYDEEGRQVYGEKKIEGSWYYFDKEKNGEMVTGWCEISVKTGGTKIVYYNEKGHMVYGEKKIDGRWYYFNKVTGARQTGWCDVIVSAGGKKRVYYGEDGRMVYGEKKIGGSWYYFDKVTGERVTNATVNGHYYGQDGKRVK